MIVCINATSVIVGNVVGIVVTGIVGIVEASDGHCGSVPRGARPRSGLGSWQG